MLFVKCWNVLNKCLLFRHKTTSEILIICNVFSFDKENVVKVLSTLEANNGENIQKHRQKNCQKVWTSEKWLWRKSAQLLDSKTLESDQSDQWSQWWWHWVQWSTGSCQYICSWQEDASSKRVFLCCNSQVFSNILILCEMSSLIDMFQTLLMKYHWVLVTFSDLLKN